MGPVRPMKLALPPTATRGVRLWCGGVCKALPTDTAVVLEALRVFEHPCTEPRRSKLWFVRTDGHPHNEYTSVPKAAEPAGKPGGPGQILPLSLQS